MSSTDPTQPRRKVVRAPSPSPPVSDQKWLSREHDYTGVRFSLDGPGDRVREFAKRGLIEVIPNTKDNLTVYRVQLTSAGLEALGVAEA